ncbi:hypothetical protein E4T66_17660 [Sinimarinibacterium sp. CAU 1509]|uniref:hypothetical protein n=1 Tax=Sinimarinibacterium sp. CAU 1509 TaxID=2562283 RepID=UPI0010AB600E|nr:hypothetical protein [Sinimarinibacterium sp. CAU 1509]TJY57235.1 hypothetical protein E4T66_17660 [Sinimarinibacterium sp. CAU 1509]
MIRLAFGLILASAFAAIGWGTYLHALDAIRPMLRLLWPLPDYAGSSAAPNMAIVQASYYFVCIGLGLLVSSLLSAVFFGSGMLRAHRAVSGRAEPERSKDTA